MPNVKIDPNDIAIRLKGLKKSFGPQDVLCDVNLDIRRGETMVIIGKSGGGKSVILKHMIGLLQPDGGEVVVEVPILAGEDVPRITYGAMALQLLRSAFLAS